MLVVLQNAIRDIIRLERNNATELENIARRLYIPKTEDGTCVGEMVAGLKQDLLGRANHSKQFIQALSSDLEERTVQKVHENHGEAYARLKKEIVASEKLLESLLADYRFTLTDSLRNVKSSLYSIFNAQAQIGPELAPKTNAAHEEMDDTPAILPQTRRLGRASSGAENLRGGYTLALQHLSDMNYTESRLQMCVQRYNQAYEVYVKQKDTMLKAMYDLDFKRMSCCFDLLTTLMVHRMALIKNQEYDTQRSIKFLDQADVSQDLKKVIESIKQSSAGLDTFTGDDRTADKQTCDDETSKTPEGEDVVQSIADAILQHKVFEGELQLLSIEDRERLERLLPTSPKNPFDNLVKTIDFWGQGPHRFRRGHEDQQLLIAIKERSYQQLRTQLVETFKAPVLSTDLYDKTDAAYCQNVCLIDDYYKLLLNGDAAAATELVEHIKLLMPEQRYRHYFCELMFASLNGEDEKELNPKTVFYSLCEVIKVLLDWTEVHHDAYCGRLIVLLSTKLYFVGRREEDPQKWHEKIELGSSSPPRSPQPPIDAAIAGDSGASDATIKWRLNRGLYDHRTWNRVAFWEEVLVMSLSEELQRQFLEASYGKNSDVYHKFLELNPFVSSVSTLPDYMIAFGIQPKEVTSLISRTCDRYNVPKLVSELLLNNPILSAEPV